jgi:hypothetical protein
VTWLGDYGRLDEYPGQQGQQKKPIARLRSAVSWISAGEKVVLADPGYQTDGHDGRRSCVFEMEPSQRRRSRQHRIE